ncbi:MAG: iodotyrosine deiodinase [Arcticibacterium sp.]|jgi:iodotyrosine deiodinase
MEQENHIKYDFEKLSVKETMIAAERVYSDLSKRRSIREFSSEPVSKEVIKRLIMTASSAPSGAHKQPWTFCAISNPEIKTAIRAAAEIEEYDSYNGRMSEEWLDDLKPFGTNWKKPFLEKAPWLIIIFKQSYGMKDGQKKQHYYVNESVGIACGFLINAIHKAGLATLTHTPSPMAFLSKILNRPSNERPFLLLPVGYPEKGVKVPDIERKSSEEVIVWY